MIIEMSDAAFRPAFRPQAIKIFKLPARNNARVSFAADETERTVHTLAIAACCISTGYVYFHACLIRRRKKITAGSLLIYNAMLIAAIALKPSS